MSKIVILEDLAKAIKVRLKNQRIFDVYGQKYPEEGLYQIWSMKENNGFLKVARVFTDTGEIYLLLDKEKIPWNKIDIIPYQSDFTSRSEGIIDTNLLSEKKVVFVGLGSVGSNMAIYLAQSSAGEFRLIDNDTLSASNVSRHACDLTHLGRFKTKAVKDLILSRNPRAHIETFEEDFLEIPFETQMERLKGSDLVIASTDSNACQLMVNEICLSLNIPSLYIGCYERAQAGEVVFVIPNKTPCFHCLMEFRAKSTSTFKKKERQMPYSDKKASGLKAEPGISIDILYPTVVSAAYALALLEPKSHRGELLDLKRNLILLHSGNKPQGEYAKIFEMPFDFVYGKSKRERRCELCHNIGFS